MSNNTAYRNGVSRRNILKASMTTVVGLSMTGIGTARGKGVTTETQDVLSQMPGEVECPNFIEEEDAEREVVSEEGATLRRTRNGISCQIQMPTPRPGEYIYPCPSETATDEEGPPEAFTLWVFVFDPDQDPAKVEGEEMDWTGAFLGGGHIVGGPNLTLSGHISKETEPVAGSKLENTDVEVHLAVAPHGALDPDLMPGQIKTPAGPGPYVWWIALFE